MKLLGLIQKLAGKNKAVENVTNLFIGENSKKRNIGFAGFAVSALLFQIGYIDAELFDTLMLLCAGWTGIAFSSKLSKLGDALKDAKKKK
jgi:hypothetical protein